MRSTTIQSILLIATSIALTACGKVASAPVTYSYGGLQENPNTASITVTNTVKVGNWSSDGVELSVTSSGASLQLGCGSGSLNAPLNLNSDNTFEVSGTYSSGVMSEIVSSDGTVTTTQNQPAIFSGSYDSTSQVLTVIMSESSTGQVIGTYALTFGDPTNPIITCY